MKLIKKIFSLIRKKKKTFIILAIVAAIILAAAFFNKKDKIEYLTVKAEKGILLQTVSEVGSVKSSQEVKLSFLGSGNLAKKYVKIGDEVKAGQILGELDYQSLLIRRREAEAALSGAQADLIKIINGASGPELSVAQAQMDQAAKSYNASLESLSRIEKTASEDLRQAEKTLFDLQDKNANTPTTYEQALLSAQTTLDSAKATYQKSLDNKNQSALSTIDSKLAVANTALDKINQILTDDDIKDTFSSKNTVYRDQTRLTYRQADELLDAAKVFVSGVGAGSDEKKIDEALDDTLAAINKTFDCLKFCYSALEASTITETTLESYKTSIDAQTTLVNSGITYLESAKQAVEDARLAYNTNVNSAQNSVRQAQVALDNAILGAKNSLSSVKLGNDQKISGAQNSAKTSRETYEVAKRQYEQLNSPARREIITASEARVDQAQAGLDLINKQIEDNIIRSPIDGKVIKDEYESGEQVSPAIPAFAVLAPDSFEVEVDISESDVAKVKEKNQVKITLDAFGDEKEFIGELESIEPAATVIQEVIYYKVKIKLIGSQEELSGIKDGMTANAEIIAGKKENVIMIPSRAIIERNGGTKLVKVLKDGVITEKLVKIGLKGDGNKTEILEGLSEGEEIIISIKNTK